MSRQFLVQHANFSAIVLFLCARNVIHQGYGYGALSSSIWHTVFLVPLWRTLFGDGSLGNSRIQVGATNVALLDHCHAPFLRQQALGYRYPKRVKNGSMTIDVFDIHQLCQKWTLFGDVPLGIRRIQFGDTIVASFWVDYSFAAVQVRISFRCSTYLFLGGQVLLGRLPFCCCMGSHPFWVLNVPFFSVIPKKISIGVEKGSPDGQCGSGE